MAPIDWSTVAQQAIAAAETSLGGTWNAVKTAATQPIVSLAQTAKYISDNADQLNDDEQKLLLDNQQLAVKNVLLGFKDIGIVAAEKAVAAAWGVVQTALITAIAKAPL